MTSRAMKYLVFASPKSGTTWLQRLLSAHPDVHCGETRLFGAHVDPSRPSGLGITLESYVANAQRHLNVPPAGASTPDTLSFERQMLFALTDQIARTTMGYSGKPIYGEKQTPYLGTAGRVLEQLRAYDREIRLIFLVRDGRDVIVSGAAQWDTLTKSKQSGTTEPATPSRGVDERYFDMFLRHWTEAATAFGEYAGKFAHTLVVRYEDMLAQPEQEAMRVLRFIGADASSERTRACVSAASFERLSGGRQRGQEDSGSFFRKGIAGDWRSKLSDEQVERFERAAGMWLRQYGYESSVAKVAEPKPGVRASPAPAPTSTLARS